MDAGSGSRTAAPSAPVSDAMAVFVLVAVDTAAVVAGVVGRGSTTEETFEGSSTKVLSSPTAALTCEESRNLEKLAKKESRQNYVTTLEGQAAGFEKNRLNFATNT